MSARVRAVPLQTAVKTKPALVDGSRVDGRAHEEFRSAFFDSGTVTQASGSAYVELGNTKVMVAVYGPHQPERGVSYSEEGSLECDVRLTTFATRQRGKPAATPLEKEWSVQLGTALTAAVRLESFPKAVLDVQCLVLEAGGSVLAAAISGASLAIADAGVEMLDLVSAAAIARMGDTMLLDPAVEEEQQAEAGALVGYMASLGQVTSLTCYGRWTREQIQDALELGVGACEQIDEALRGVLQAKLAVVAAE